ncbi:MAG: hypothetical protein GY909_02805 [Oligoflexia bacterium]|nr:hypothetical protein [Oligoflexia bacterium]
MNMLTDLCVVNLPAGTELSLQPCGDVFFLNTCQRVMIVGYGQRPFQYILNTAQNPSVQILKEGEAYQYLLETICGLKSKIQGEYEVVSQFKKAYHEFTTHDQINGKVLRVLEKLFKDAKEVRRKHLQEIGLLTYAGIVRKLLCQRFDKGQSILLLGSGQLAEDILKISHRRFDFHICARNEDRVSELTNHFTSNRKCWSTHSQWHDFDVVINTIGTTAFNIEDDIVHEWRDAVNENFAICLGEPSIFSDTFGLNHNILKLNEIFAHGEEMSRVYKEKIEFAKERINHLVNKRSGDPTQLKTNHNYL